MNHVRRASPRLRRALVTAIVAGLCGGAAIYLAPRGETTIEKKAEILLGQATYQPGLGDRLHRSVWKRLPQFAADHLSDLAPVPVARRRLTALQELEFLRPNSGEVVSRLLPLLDDPAMSGQVIKVFEAIGPAAKAAIGPLIALVSKPPAANAWDYYHGPLHALASIDANDERVLALFLERLPDPHAEVLTIMLQHASSYGADVQKRLLALASTPSGHDFRFIHLIGKIEPQSPQTRAFVLSVLEADDYSGRIAALELLIENPVSDPPFIRALTEAFRDCVAQMNAYAARYAARPLLPGRMRISPPLTLPIKVCAALGALGPAAAPALPVLRENLPSLPLAVRVECALAIFRIDRDSSPLEATLPQALEDSDESIRHAAIRELVHLARESDATLPLLRACLKNPDRHIRIQAIRGLVALGPAAAPAVPELERLLADPSFSVRLDATNCLEQLRRLPPQAK